MTEPSLPGLEQQWAQLYERLAATGDHHAVTLTFESKPEGQSHDRQIG
jgi:hypothetical protein